MVDGLKELENYQFIKIRKAKGGDSKIALTVGLDEIMSALCDHPILKTYFEF